MYPIRLRYDPSSLGKEFDSRSSEGGKWEGYIGGIRDQGWCGASWAFSTVAVVQDRLAIQSRGHEVVNLAPQNLISCNHKRQHGCTGGYVDVAWNYIKKFG